jgi:hypothetical protein
MVWRTTGRKSELQSQSYFVIDGRSVGQCVLALSPFGTYGQILVVVKDSCAFVRRGALQRKLTHVCICFGDQCSSQELRAQSRYLTASIV